MALVAVAVSLLLPRPIMEQSTHLPIISRLTLLCYSVPLCPTTSTWPMSLMLSPGLATPLKTRKTNPACNLLLWLTLSPPPLNSTVHTLEKRHTVTCDTGFHTNGFQVYLGIKELRKRRGSPFGGPYACTRVYNKRGTRIYWCNDVCSPFPWSPISIHIMLIANETK
jgi:hypothetical protein